MNLARRCSDPALRNACLLIRRCVPILDMMVMSTQYGVMAFTEDGLKEICRFIFGIYLFITVESYFGGKKLIFVKSL